MSERLKAAQLIEYLAEHHPLVTVVRVPNYSTSHANWRKQLSEGAEKGCADYIFILPGGLSVAWELKATEKDKRTSAQKVWLARHKANLCPQGWGTWRPCIAYLEGILSRRITLETGWT